MAGDLSDRMEETLLLLDRLREFIVFSDEELQESSANVQRRVETSRRIIGELESSIAGHRDHLRQSEFEARLIRVAIAAKHPEQVSAELAEFVKVFQEALKFSPELLRQFTI